MILIRPAIPADRDFIVSGWSTSYRGSRDCTIPMALYAKQKHEEIDYYLADRHVRVLVAHGDSGVLFGFIAFDPTVYAARIAGRLVTLYGNVLYIYTAGPFREKFGVARTLFAAAGIDPNKCFGYSCRTRWSWILRSKIPLAEHEPFRARYGEIEHVRRIVTAEAAGSEADRADSSPHDPAP